MDVQNNYINRIATRVVLPMRNTYLCAQCMGKLNPLFEIAANQVMLDTAAELKKPVLSLGAQSEAVMDALDVLFGAY